MKRDVVDSIASDNGYRRGLLGLAVSGVAVAIIIFAFDVNRQIESLGTASSDNVQWVLTQSEIEAMELESAATRAILEGPEALGALRLKFDVFYSRIATLRESPVFSDLRQDFGVSLNVKNLTAYLDAMVPLIDGPDDALFSALPLIIEETRSARAETRSTALKGIEIFSQLADRRRDSVSDTLLRIAVLTIALILALLGLVVLLMRLVRSSELNTVEIRQTHDRMETIISTSLDAVVVSDRDGCVIEYNGAAERVFGYPRSAAIGTNMGDLIIPEHFRAMHNAGMKRYLEDGTSHVIGQGIVQLEARRMGGEIFPVDLSLAVADSPDGEIFVGFLRDISDRVRSENDLKDARDRAIAGEKSKAELLAVMSHEMRTPLNGMLGTLDLIDLTKLDARTKRYLRIIRGSSELLLSHVNDVLEISRLDAGKMNMQKERFDLIALMREIIDSQTGRAQENGNVVRLAPPSPELHEVYSDPARLRQILLNLVGNAIKFTQDGTVTLETELHDSLREVEIRVIDTGVGISSDDLDRIFGDFVTIDTSYGRSNTGTGLGLGIAQRLSTALGGELGAESEPGDGSVFWLRLPLNAPIGTPRVQSQPTPNEEDVPDLPPLDILMVEDNEVNRIVARELLERDGHHVTEAHNGREGVEAATNKTFDLILMDVSMPEMDGVTATRLIRKGPSNSSDVPIIAATAHALPDDLAVFRDAGMNDVLVKPISAKSIRLALANALLDDDGDEDERVILGDITSSALIIDWDRLEELEHDLTTDQLRTALVQFRSDLDQFMTDASDWMQGAIDRTNLSQEAHRMAGSAGVFGAMRLTNQMRTLQTEAKTATPSALNELVAEVKTSWKLTRTELDKVDALPITEIERS